VSLTEGSNSTLLITFSLQSKQLQPDYLSSHLFFRVNSVCLALGSQDETAMNKKGLISFDLDCTLIEPTYTTLVWEIGIPQLYAEKHSIDLPEATSIVKAEYERLGDSSLEWYDISYWFGTFKLPGRWQDLMEVHRDKIRPFPEVKEVLEILVKDYDLVILSNAAREFVDIEIQEAHINRYFARAFSTTSDFQEVKKTARPYRIILDIMGARPSDAMHVGDHYEFDYLVPKGLGIEAFYLDRDAKGLKDASIVHDLREFLHAIKLREKLDLNK
jgi:FMN phosphatase YigB (HAD superfamily)